MESIDRAYGELATTVARHFTSRFGVEASKGGEFRDFASIISLQATQMLCDLGIVERIPGNERQRKPIRYRLNMNLDSVPDVFELERSGESYKKDKILSSFVCICCIYDRLSYHRAWFIPPTPQTSFRRPSLSLIR